MVFYHGISCTMYHLFNIVKGLCVFYNEEHRVYWLAYDTTLFAVRDNTKDVVKAFKEIGETLIKWFSNI